MMSSATCPACGKSARIPDGYSGTKVKCPRCGARIELDVPSPSPDGYGIELDDALVSAAPAPPETELPLRPEPRPGRRQPPPAEGVHAGEPRWEELLAPAGEPPVAAVAPSTANPPDPAALSLAQALSDHMRSLGSREMPPEPWYYNFIGTCATLWGLMGLLPLAGSLLGLLIFLASDAKAGPERAEMSHGEWESRLYWILGGVSVGFGFAVATALVSAVALLAVDAARNVRATRYHR